MAKKGKASPVSFTSAIQCVVFLPFTLMLRLVFYPVDFCMWILCDIVAAGKHPWLGTVAFTTKFPAVKKTANYVKEFRQVLIDYFFWPKWKNPRKTGSRKCLLCGVVAEFWCEDCKDQYCTKCGYMMHGPGTKKYGHSLEKIKEEDERPIQFLSPLLPAFVILGFIYCCTVTIQRDYLTSQVMCPNVSRIRGLLAWVEPSLYVHYKNTIFTMCDSEDTFLRYIYDTWVRGIVTGADNTFLVFNTFPKAFAFNFVIVYVLVPIFAVFGAIVQFAVYQIESMMGHDEILKTMETIAKQVKSWYDFVFPDVSTTPPHTHPRMRRDEDSVEGFLYHCRRYFRWLRSFYDDTVFDLQKLVWEILIGSAIMRVAILWLGIGPLLRLVFRIILWPFGTFRNHYEWFNGRSSHLMDESTIWSLFHMVRRFASGMLRYLPHGLWMPTYMWIFIFLMFVGGMTTFCNYIVEERRQFAQEEKKDTAQIKQAWHEHFNEWRNKMAASADLEGINKMLQMAS